MADLVYKQIHELDALARAPQDADVLALDTGSVTAKVSFQALMAGAKAETEAVAANFAPAFDEATANAAGSYVTYTDGKMYYLPDGHEANATWANTAKAATTAGYELSLINGAFFRLNDSATANTLAIYNVKDNATSYQVTFTWDANGEECTVTGTSTAGTNASNVMFATPSIFPDALRDRKPIFHVKSTNREHLYAQALYYRDGSLTSDRIDLRDGITQIEIPSDITGFMLRLIADKGGITYNDRISVKLLAVNGIYIPSMHQSTVDVTAHILAALNAYGECRLGPGIYGVSGIDMPAGSMLSGCGDQTVLRLIGSAGGYAVKMASNCTVKDMTIEGAAEDITLSETPGKRHGIEWYGDYSTNHPDKENQPSYGTICNVFIRRFTGGGIRCYRTGPQVNHGVNVTDVSIVNCNAGIYISNESEYNRFANAMVYQCQYGCVNNSGNNMFVNCGFSNNKTGMILKHFEPRYTDVQQTRENPDWKNEISNNTHGSAIGCVFNHMDRDDISLGAGEAVHFEGATNGFIFDGCQLFFASIYLEDSHGIVFSDCLFGQHKDSSGETDGVPITLKNTGSSNLRAFFNDCNFTVNSPPVFTIVKSGSGTIAPVINASYNRKGEAVGSEYWNNYTKSEVDDALIRKLDIAYAYDVCAPLIEESVGPDNTVSFADGANNAPVKSLTAQIDPVQTGSGDPSPSNVRPITGWTGCKIRHTILRTDLTLAGIQADIAAGTVAENARRYPVGDQIVIPWKDMDDANHNTDATAYRVAWDIVHHDTVELRDGTQVPGMFLQMHLCSAYGVQFSAPQAFINCAGGLAAGTYCFTLNAAYGDIPANSILEFTLSGAVPENGRIRMATDRTVTTWAAGGTAAIETVTAAIVESSSGTDLGTTGSGGLNIIQRMQYGSNRWSTSAIRQYLNSSGSGWWESVGAFDIRPDQYGKKGFMSGFGDDFLSAIRPVRVTTALNTAEGYSEATEDTFDTFFLPALQQMYIQPQLADAEGNYFEYWKNRLGLNSYAQTGSGNVYDAFRITAINANSAQTVRLRSANRDNVHITWYANPSGYVSNYGYASGAYRFSPVCVICG